MDENLLLSLSMYIGPLFCFRCKGRCIIKDIGNRIEKSLYIFEIYLGNF